MNSSLASTQGGRLYALMPLSEQDLFGSAGGDGDVSRDSPVNESSERQPDDPRPLLSPQQVSELSGLHEEVVRRAIRAGELRASKLRGKLRVRLEDFDAWVDQNTVSLGDWS